MKSWLLILASIALCGCSSEDDAAAGTGGQTGTGGQAGASAGGSGGAAGGCQEKWIEDVANPQIHFQDFGGAVWNDPWVLKQNGEYRMWTTSGAGGIDVKIYELRSSDGASWAPASTPLAPQLVPGPDDWDAIAVETASVVELAGTYHLYYTAVPNCPDPPACTYTLYEIGHASSPDGITWQKSSAPVVTRPPNAGDWGSWGIAEPGATVKDGTIFLYYTMVRCRGGAPCTPTQPMAERGIGLSTSTDGETFTANPNNPILVQTENYPAAELYEGYSTPAALFADEKIHLFYDVAQTVDGSFRQVALAHATSLDGTDFVETPDILRRDPAGWTAFEIRAPTVVDEGDHFAMWFAGNNGNSPTVPGFEIGIGRATMQKCAP